MKSILDPEFRYTKSIDTDLRKTFARIRREQAKARAADEERRATQRIVAFSKPVKR